MGRLQALDDNRAYSNWVMVGPDNTMMCRCAEKRARWYLDRGLAEQISNDPPTVRLNFTPGGPGNQGDAFSLAAKHNRCVVCGAKEDLTKHHIVPYMYRRFLPAEVKGRSSHDVVVICIDCHDAYERHATELKMVIAKEKGLEYNEGSRMTPEARDYHRVTSFAHTLITQGERIPRKRREAMMDLITGIIGRVPSTDDLIELSYSEKWMELPEYNPGKSIVDNVIAAGELQPFVERWRAHFLDIAKPAYMPEFWSVTRPIVIER